MWIFYIAILNEPCQNLEALVDQHDSELQNILDVHVSMKKQVITIKPNTEWYSDEIREELESHWHFSLLEIDRQFMLTNAAK